MGFPTDVIESAAGDAKALASWRPGNDVQEVVRPLSITAAWAYAEQDVFDEVMKRRGLQGGAPSKFLKVVNDAMFVCARAYVQPVIGGEAGGAIVVFRGTEPTDVINWLADATVEKVAFHTDTDAHLPRASRGYVHDGFYRNLRAIWPQVVEELQKLDPGWIYLTGHSFGGALAVLAGGLLADYAEEERPNYGQLWDKVRGIFTFGQPIVGDAKFAEVYQKSVGKKLVRFVYAHDIVPHLPPKTSWKPVPFGTEYRAASPAAEGRRWVEANSLSEPVSEPLGPNLVAGLSWIKEQSGLAPKLPLKYSWGDHAPNNYVRVSLLHGADSGSEFD